MIKKDNWVYIHVPKTAGTTTENLFRDNHNLIVEDEVHTTVSVSYTHLTLPPIYSV